MYRIGIAYVTAKATPQHGSTMSFRSFKQFYDSFVFTLELALCLRNILLNLHLVLIMYVFSINRTKYTATICITIYKH